MSSLNSGAVADAFRNLLPRMSVWKGWSLWGGLLSESRCVLLCTDSAITSTCLA